MNRVLFVLLSIFSVVYIISDVRNKNFSIKESFWWLITSMFILILSIFPKLLDYFAIIIGISYPPSLLFLISTIFLILINFKNSKRISELELKVIEISQHLAIIKYEKDNNRKKDKKNG